MVDYDPSTGGGRFMDVGPPKRSIVSLDLLNRAFCGYIARTLFMDRPFTSIVVLGVDCHN